MTRGRLVCAANSRLDDAKTAGVCANAPALNAKTRLAAIKPVVIFGMDRDRCATGAHRQPLGWRGNLPYNIAMTGQFDDWRRLAAPSLADIEALAAEAYARLPERFRNLCQGLVIRVEDFPAQDVAESMRLESDFDLLGLFQGVGLPFQSDSVPELMPNMIWLYRRPILDYWAEHEDTLGEIVTHVLVHEIGHHFGLSDEDIEAIEASAE